jgi:single-strand DNA-binding protein
MKSLNQVQIIGRLGADPEIKNLSEGGKLCSLSIATDYTYKSKIGEQIKTTDWHRATFFGKICDHIEKFLAKGESVYVSGRLHTREYVNKEGEKKRITEILADQIIFLSLKKNNDLSPSNEADRSTLDSPIPPPPTDDIPF